MTLTEAELEAKLAAVAAKAKAPLLEDLHTMTRALADGHRRVDAAVEARHKSEADRNAALGTIKILEREKAGLSSQVTRLQQDLKQAQRV